MIRPAIPNDIDALIALADASGLFGKNEIDELREVLTGCFGDSGNDHFWLADDDNGVVVGVAYYAPERMTEGTWNLYLIAVRPDRQGQGRGAALMHYMEQALIERGARMLLVETSGLTNFERTRAFYRKCDYDEEARIRDFYQAGDDKIIYRKVLTGSGAD